jgi:hypothetical protein
LGSEDGLAVVVEVVVVEAVVLVAKVVVVEACVVAGASVVVVVELGCSSTKLIVVGDAVVVVVEATVLVEGAGLGVLCSRSPISYDHDDGLSGCS